MSTRPLLSGTRLRTPGQKQQPGADTDALPAPADETPPAAAEVKQRKPKPLKARAKQMIVYLNPAAHTQLKILAAQEGRQLNDLATEAFNLFFKSRQLPQNAAPE